MGSPSMRWMKVKPTLIQRFVSAGYDAGPTLQGHKVPNCVCWTPVFDMQTVFI